MSAIGRPLLSRTAFILGGAVKKKGSWNMQPPSQGRREPLRRRSSGGSRAEIILTAHLLDITEKLGAAAGNNNYTTGPD